MPRLIQKTTVFLLLTIGLVMHAQAQGAQTDTDLKQAIALHEQARLGDENAVQKTLDLLRPMITSDALAQAYYGSALTLKGRDAWMPWIKIKYVEQGLDHLDGAVDKAPDNLEIRLVRAAVGINLPERFQRLGSAGKDLKFINGSALFGAQSPAFTQSYFFWLARWYQKQGNSDQARIALKSMLELHPGGTLLEEARALQAEL